jgi:ABC-type polysaccharide transport system permease subunit
MPLIYRRICLFGTGIAFPKFHFDAENELDPWVGFRKSIEQTELMVNIVHCPP